MSSKIPLFLDQEITFHPGHYPSINIKNAQKDPLDFAPFLSTQNPILVNPLKLQGAFLDKK
jgi:hypothetical protein